MNLPDMPSVREAFGVLGKRIQEVHLHDNGGERDEHCWPGEGSVDWNAVRECMASLAPEVKGVLEIYHQPETEAKTLSAKAVKSFAMVETAAAG